MNATNPSMKRTKSFKIFFIFLIVVLLGSLAYEFLLGMHYETTDNAYVSAPQLQISSQVEGTISAVLVGETQFIKAGETLYRVDKTESKIAAEIADADLIKSVKMVRGLVLNVEQKKQDFDHAHQDYQRRLSLKGDAAYSAEELERFKNVYENSKNLYEQALENAYGIRRFQDIDQHPDVIKALAIAKKNYVNLIRSEVRAPVDAIVAKRNAQVGQRVVPGTVLASLVLKNTIWVDANFKENQLAKLRVGQPVELETDTYGSSVKFTGKIIGFSPSTGSALSLLPAQNATGNWVKVVQRLPVRIEVDHELLKKYPLKFGLSMSVKVDVKDLQGTPLEPMQQNDTIATALFEQQVLDAEKHVLSIFTKANR
jgi:membrane fusion protein (multidrug efflux system)